MPVASFSILSLYLILGNLMMMCFGVFLFGSNFFGTFLFVTQSPCRMTDEVNCFPLLKIKRKSSLVKSERSQIIIAQILLHLWRPSQHLKGLPIDFQGPLLGGNALVPPPLSLYCLLHRSAALFFPFPVLPLPSLRKECDI